VAVPPSPTVAQLLAESRAHHQAKNRLANRRINKQFTPDYKGAEVEIAQALEKRLAAHAMDPTHADPAWSLDRAAHEDLVAFYRLYGTIE
jgi:aryl-alcohol dehydrogenase-like predicted oxidoreductase